MQDMTGTRRYNGIDMVQNGKWTLLDLLIVLVVIEPGEHLALVSGLTGREPLRPRLLAVVGLLIVVTSRLALGLLLFAQADFTSVVGLDVFEVGSLGKNLG